MDYVVNLLGIIVYGDDFLYNKGMDDECAPYFSGQAYKEWLEKYFKVGLRDLKDGTSLASVEHNGFLTHKGATFLKMNAVINPHFTEKNGQCRLLPFRELREYVMRCFNGREPKNRDILDMLLSTIAHAYGTYASNAAAYKWLNSYYDALIYENGLMEVSSIDEVVSRLSARDLKQFRMLGMDLDDVKSGFPKWSTLISKNVWDENYHSITGYELTTNEMELTYEF